LHAPDLIRSVASSFVMGHEPNMVSPILAIPAIRRAGIHMKRAIVIQVVLRGQHNVVIQSEGLILQICV
jgi:hypothetical protein